MILNVKYGAKLCTVFGTENTVDQILAPIHFGHLPVGLRIFPDFAHTMNQYLSTI